METHQLQLPLMEDALARLKIGDIVFLNGLMFTGRVGFYRLLLDQGRKPPIDIGKDCNVNFHCSPAVAEVADGEYRITSMTGTASFRFAQWMPDLLGRYGVKAIVGKGGMQPEVYRSAFKDNKAVYLTTIGYGLGACYGRGIKRVVDVFWENELGLAQAMWIIEAKNMGPFLVESDILGNSLQEIAKQVVDQTYLPLTAGFPPPTLKRIGETRAGEETIK
jgi:L(+)-tartrate dehydratase beta subunit